MESQDSKSQDNLEHKEQNIQNFKMVIMETADKVTESITNPAESPTVSMAQS